MVTIGLIDLPTACMYVPVLKVSDSNIYVMKDVHCI